MDTKPEICHRTSAYSCENDAGRFFDDRMKKNPNRKAASRVATRVPSTRTSILPKFMCTSSFAERAWSEVNDEKKIHH